MLEKAKNSMEKHAKQISKDQDETAPEEDTVEKIDEEM